MADRADRRARRPLHSSSTRSRDASRTSGSRRCSATGCRARRRARFSMMINDYGFGLLSPTADRAVAAATSARCSPRPASSRHPRRAQRRRARAAAVPRDRARRGPRVPGLSRTAAIEPAAAGVERTALRRVREYDPDNLLLRAGDARGARAAARGAAARRGARADARLRAVVTQPARPTPFAFPLMVEIFREKLTTEALEARVARMVAELEAAAQAR